MELHEIRSDDDAKTYSAERKARCKYYKPLLEARVIYWFEHLTSCQQLPSERQ